MRFVSVPTSRPLYVAGQLALLVLFCLASTACSVMHSDLSGMKQRELRGVWITNVDSDVLTSREKIAEAMDFLAAHHFNVVYPVVWNKAMTLYPSDVMEREFGVRIDPLYEGRDPLREVIEEAHQRGIEVVPWFEYGFAASYNEGGGPLLEARPEWAAIDRDGNLVTKNGFEWMNSMHPEVQDFLLSLVIEVVRNYDVDGIQGDDRLPAMPTIGGYDEYTIALYKKETGKTPPDNPKEEEWVRWRADKLTGFLARLRSEVHKVKPGLIISMSPSYYDWSLYEYLQDSKTWVDRGLVDSIHPQAYRYSFEDYAKIVDDLVMNQFAPEQLPLLAPGVLICLGSYTIEEDYFLKAIAYNRAMGIDGEVFFFYEGLRRNDDALGKALLAGPYAEPAELPYR